MCRPVNCAACFHDWRQKLPVLYKGAFRRYNKDVRVSFSQKETDHENRRSPEITKDIRHQKKDKAHAPDGSFGDLLTEGTKGTQEASSSRSIAQVDALLTVQQTDDPAQRAAKGRMKIRADKLLEGLDRIRTRLLTGQMTVGDVIDIADVVASHRERITDPALSAILDEIDLRAQIELAKMRMALDKKTS